MAKKKTVNPEENKQELENSAKTATTEALNIVQEMETVDDENIDKAEVKPAVEVVENHEQGLPAHVDRLLKIFSNYEELYIDDRGSVFSKDTQPNLVEGAILYQNPYYNK